jgi:hypothetical protein
MKQIIFIIPAIIAAAFFIGCGDKTELSFTNGSDSSGAINEIIWASGDANWTQTNGWDIGATTDSKEVNQTKASVTCTVYDSESDKWFLVEPTVGDTSANVAVLSEGSSNNYTLNAKISGSASVKK